MKKSGANASWNELPQTARNQVAAWLFDERLNYRTILARARKEFGYRGSLSSLKRFYQRASRERVVAGFADALTQAKEIEGAEAGTDLLRKAGLKVMGQLFLRQVTEAPEDVQKWGWLAKLLLQSEENEIRQRTAAEQNERRREVLKLARERLEFDLIEQAYRALPELKALERARAARTRTRFSYMRYINEIRRQLFGLAEDPPPQNRQEELAMQTKITRENRKRECAHQQQWEEEEKEDQETKKKREQEERAAAASKKKKPTDEESEEDPFEDENSEDVAWPNEEPSNENPQTP